MVPFHSKCIFSSVDKNSHILFKLSAKLLIAASLFCVLFGNGTHLHSVFDHFLDHGHIHAYVHAHPADSNYDHNYNYAEEFDREDAHQHPTATIDLEGILAPKTVDIVFSDEINFTEAGEIPSVHNIKEVNPLFLDLPPPDPLVLSIHFSSFSLRGPPLG